MRKTGQRGEAVTGCGGGDGLKGSRRQPDRIRDSQLSERNEGKMADNNYERLGRELIHKGAIIDYYQDTIRVANGNIVKWDLISHKGAAAVVAVKDDGKLLMVRQYRNALDRETLEIPAGGLNGTEEPTDIAAKLELLLTLRTTVAFCNEKIDVYLATDLKPGKQHLDEDEFLNVESHDLDELVQMIFDCKIQDGKTVSSILAYDKKIHKE